jgi:hypothetical protein
MADAPAVSLTAVVSSDIAGCCCCCCCCCRRCCCTLPWTPPVAQCFNDAAAGFPRSLVDGLPQRLNDAHDWYSHETSESTHAAGLTVAYARLPSAVAADVILAMRTGQKGGRAPWHRDKLNRLKAAAAAAGTSSSFGPALNNSTVVDRSESPTTCLCLRSRCVCSRLLDVRLAPPNLSHPVYLIASRCVDPLRCPVALRSFVCRALCDSSHVLRFCFFRSVSSAVVSSPSLVVQQR